MLCLLRSHLQHNLLTGLSKAWLFMAAQLLLHDNTCNPFDLTYIWNHLHPCQQFNFNICYNWTKSVTFKTSQCQGWDFQKLSRRPQLSCRGSSVVSFKNPDKSFPCISPFQCHGHGHGHTSQCQGWNLNFQKLSGSCPGLSLNNLQTNHFRKTKDKEFCDSGITFRWIPLELLCLTSFRLLLLS